MDSLNASQKLVQLRNIYTDENSAYTISAKKENGTHNILGI